MYYDSQVIYRTMKHDLKDFTLNNERFYLTPKGKTKKINKEGKRINISIEEFDNAQKQYKFIFDL